MTKHLGTVPIDHGLEKMWQLSNDWQLCASVVARSAGGGRPTAGAHQHRVRRQRGGPDDRPPEDAARADEASATGGRKA